MWWGQTGGGIRNCWRVWYGTDPCSLFHQLSKRSIQRVEHQLFIKRFSTSPQIKGYRPHFSISCVLSNVYAFKISEVILKRTKIFQTENRIVLRAPLIKRATEFQTQTGWHCHTRNEILYIFILLMQIAFRPCVAVECSTVFVLFGLLIQILCAKIFSLI